MRVIFHHRAEAELIDAAQFYQNRVPGLGNEFLDAVDMALKLIAAAPLQHRIQHLEARRSIVDRFPYSVYYRVFTDHIRILAIHHHSRRPGYWQGRTKD